MKNSEWKTVRTMKNEWYRESPTTVEKVLSMKIDINLHLWGVFSDIGKYTHQWKVRSRDGYKTIEISLDIFRVPDSLRPTHLHCDAREKSRDISVAVESPHKWALDYALL